MFEATLNGGIISAEVRAANSITELPAWPFRPVTGGVIPPGIKGRYIEVRFNFLRGFGTAQDPMLTKVTLGWGGPGSDLQIIEHPKSRILRMGIPAEPTFTVSATGTQLEYQLQYQWYHDGSALAGATESAITIASPQFSDAGKYYVRVTDETGTFLDSAEARLHVNSTPNNASAPLIYADNPAPALGSTVVLTAEMNITPTPGPFHYQWRKNGVPIPGASGSCTPDLNGTCTVTYTIDSVQCQHSAAFSAVFISSFWRMASQSLELALYDSGTTVQTIHITPASPVTISDPNLSQTLSAASCDPLSIPFAFSPSSYQWYVVSGSSEQYGQAPIPGAAANAKDYVLPTPIQCQHYTVYTFDEGGFPYPRRARPQGNDNDITTAIIGNCQ